MIEQSMAKKPMHSEGKRAFNFQWINPLIEGIPPCQRGGHSATKVGRTIFFFGGHYYEGQEEGFRYLNDLYILDIDNNKWIRPHFTGIPPSPRYFHASVLAGQKIFFFGGRGPRDRVLKDLHALDPETLEWFEGPEGSGSPTARFGHSASVISGNRIVIFGGQNGEIFFNDVHILHLDTMSWSKPSLTGQSPAPRFNHSAVLIKQTILIFGGFYFNESFYYSKNNMGERLKQCYLNDMKLLDTEKMQWLRFNVSGTSPTPRMGQSLNISGNNLVLFGGWSFDEGLRKNEHEEGEVGYFKILNTSDFSWEGFKFSCKVPINRYGHTATTIGQHILVFGGWEYNRATNDTIILRNLNSEE